MKQNLFYISAIDDRIWIRGLATGTPDLALKILPSWRDKNLWYVSLETQADIPEILMSLRDNGLAFLDEPAGWPPAAIFAKLRKDGVVNGNYSTITFVGNGNYEIQDGK